ncbi:MAG: 2-C-methyl-D-erythritol 2,4-cyclodiphosphate synthase [Bacteroidetes bacterium]|nr:2-C-methyl-D-erythritol 2,4-cyclodiphosphate synthase [Bacteroidota bacterium]
MYRIGYGYDIHKLAANRPFVLGGVTIPFEKGPVGHSDADVLLHAVCDALLGALALGDIGRHFPDTDVKFKDISSIALLRQCHTLILSRGYTVVNIDSTVILQAPKIAPFVEQMSQNIASVTGLQAHEVSVKATTAEGLGFVGAGDGVIAHATTLLRKK